MKAPPDEQETLITADPRRLSPLTKAVGGELCTGSHVAPGGAGDEDEGVEDSRAVIEPGLLDEPVTQLDALDPAELDRADDAGAAGNPSHEQELTVARVLRDVQAKIRKLPEDVGDPPLVTG